MLASDLIVCAWRPSVAAGGLAGLYRPPESGAAAASTRMPCPCSSCAIRSATPLRLAMKRDLLAKVRPRPSRRASKLLVNCADLDATCPAAPSALELSSIHSLAAKPG